MATISKRKGAYQIIVSLGYDEAGKQIRKTTTDRIPEGTTPKSFEDSFNDTFIVKALQNI